MMKNKFTDAELQAKLNEVKKHLEGGLSERDAAAETFAQYVFLFILSYLGEVTLTKQTPSYLILNFNSRVLATERT